MLWVMDVLVARKGQAGYELECRTVRVGSWRDLSQC